VRVGIWWESRRLVSSGHTYVFHGEGGEISVAVRTGERHEVSEQLGMPNPESSHRNFVAMGG